MRLCANCLATDDRAATHCAACGSNALGKVTAAGDVIGLPAAVPCFGCGSPDHALKFRYFRYVVAMIFVDQVYATAGYYCPSCIRRYFLKYTVTTMLLGWWGIFAFLFRNPFAIATNFWGLFAAPLGASAYGAMTVNALREQARAKPDVSVVPDWLSDIPEADLELILAATDYYETLDLPRTASGDEIKRAWRTRVKTLHPDTAQGDGSLVDLLVVNDAYRVLSTPRLRSAYDRMLHERSLA